MSLRNRIHEVVFEADTPAGRAFDVALFVSIVVSVTAVMLDSVDSIRAEHGILLRTIEWFFTVLFTVEYAVRLAVIGRPWRYAVSTFGVIDLLAILPTYLSVVFAGSQSLLVIRALRLMRVFRVLKMVRFVGEADVLSSAIRESARKIIVFLTFVLTVVLIVGAAMYLIEGDASGFTNIPQSMYWAIVTMTTVGYGDIAPQTILGKALASLVMILGYGVIAVPTGIVTVELGLAGRRHAQVSTQACPSCAAEGHDPDARFCKYCGEAL
ncbi:MAG TPA: ion transporter [Candidatus Krumholzibacteria bacterium]|nr:ion transporter [Candidatus Krumholzibacteria bacterium]